MSIEEVREARRARIAQLREELAALTQEDTVDAGEVQKDLLTRCRVLMEDGLSIAAVRLYRNETGSTLGEAAHALGIPIRG